MERNWWVVVASAPAVSPRSPRPRPADREAAAQAGEVEPPRQQLLITQRISQAAVRRGNGALERLPEWAVMLARGELVRASKPGISANRTGVGTYRLGS